MNVNMSNPIQTLNTSTSNQTSNASSSTQGNNDFLNALQSAISTTEQTKEPTLNIEDIEELLESGNVDSSQLLMSLLGVLQQDTILSEDGASYEDILTGLNGDVNNVDSLIGILQGENTNNDLLNALSSAVQGYVKTEEQTTNPTQIVENALSTDWDLPSNIPSSVIENINSMRQARDNIRAMTSDLRNLKTETVEQVVQDGIVAPEQIDTANTNNFANVATVNNLADANITNVEVAVTKEQMNANVEAIASNVNTTENSDVDSNLVDADVLKLNEITVKYQPTVENEVVDDVELRNNILTQIKDQMVLMKSEGKDTFTMQLNPESLGKLDVKMVLENGSLSVEILATNQKTYELILSSMGELKTLLEGNLANNNAMNLDNQKQWYNQEQGNGNQHNQQQQEQNQDENDSNSFPTIFELEDEIDFYKELANIRNHRFNTINYIQ